MKLTHATPFLITLALGACGKKAPAPEAMKPAETAKAADVAAPTAVDKADAAQPAAPDTAEKVSAADVAAAADVAVAADGVAAGDATPTKVEAPSLWASLFEKDRASEWDVAETVTTTEQKDDGTVGKTSTKELSGKQKCSVKSVEASKLQVEGRKGEAVTLSTIECTGYNFDNGVAEGPQGTWVTDGKALWKRLGDLDEPRFELPPGEKTEKSEEQEVTVKASDKPGTWCWRMALLMGDGGVLEACFDEARGPYRFFGHGGSAMTETKVTVTLVP
jgi:hypothetical protein